MLLHVVTPHICVGPVWLGMTRDEARAAVPEPPTPFRKDAGEEYETDAFDTTGLHVYYAGPEPYVVFVEAFAAPGVAFDFLGMDPLALPAATAIRLLRKITRLIEDEPGSYLLENVDVALWLESESEPHFTALSVGARGYFAAPAR